ncbi:MAG: ROK family protein [Rhodothermales bacterium]|nr:ROK family protein [Rhodothermales bacterium]MBO6780081.1 ROK family protein [Rhodothermales bacterium]
MKVLGIDVGGSGVKGAIVDVKDGTLQTERHRIPTPKPATPEAVAATVRKVARHFKWKGPIGCTLPARIQKGVAKTAANIHESWINTPVKSLLQEATQCPVAVLNDADAAGVASMEFGAGRGRKDLVIMLTVGTGIGSAMFHRGRLIPGSELGHLPLHGDSAEVYAADSARKRDALSWADWAARFQEYLDLVEFLLAPDLIILGGGVSRPGKVKEFRHLLNTRAEFVPAVLENEAGMIGAAVIARKKARKRK